MKPFTRSIIELFDGKKRFLIPLYQRQYAWRVQPQLEPLWADIEQAVIRVQTDRASLSPHFMGAIVIAQIKTYGKQVQAFEIIDGQQRLTTFQILLAAFRDIARTRESRYADELSKYLLNDGVMENSKVERFKLWPSLTDRRAFAEIVALGTDLDAIAPKPADEDGYVRRATSAYEYFRNRIDHHVSPSGLFEEERLEILFEAMKDGLAIVSIELEGGDDPQTIFETLNSRGVDLTAADLLRNFIFQRAKGLGQTDGSLVIDRLYEQHWLPLDRAFWSQAASRGRQTRSRLDWMLTDHLSMHLGDIVSVETLFEQYRRWLLSDQPFNSVIDELVSITATAAIERRLFEQDASDPIGDFGRFADAFDVSTAMPLIVYLATTADVGPDLPRALAALKSYILRRDICNLGTKSYNRFFVGIIDRLRRLSSGRVDAMITYLEERQLYLDRWPDDQEFRRGWIHQAQYKGPRQPRLRYVFEAIERAKRTSLNEDIVIRSALTIEHIMPQGWQVAWPVPGFGSAEKESQNEEYQRASASRSALVNTLGNLTLLTQSLNSSVSNGPYSVKMPAVRAHSSLALNRELVDYDSWDEDAILERGGRLFALAIKIWPGPTNSRPTGSHNPDTAPSQTQLRQGFPVDGTACRFTYGGRDYGAVVKEGALYLLGNSEPYYSFSAASKGVTGTSRNGWMDWQIESSIGQWILANDWRRG